MDYMKLLQSIRDNAQQAAEAKRRLMAASQSSAETDEWKRRYMRCQGEFERDRETAREIIRSAKDPEVMRLLYLRKVKNILSNSLSEVENRIKPIYSTIHDHMVSAEITIDEPQNTEVSNTNV